MLYLRQKEVNMADCNLRQKEVNMADCSPKVYLKVIFMFHTRDIIPDTKRVKVNDRAAKK